MTARIAGSAAAVTARARCAAVSVSACSAGSPADEHRLRRRRHVGHLQHQHRRRCRIGRAAGVRPGADGLQLSRTRRPDRRRPRLRHHLGGRPRAAGARLRDQRQARCIPTASRSPATTWCWRGRRSPVGSRRSTRPTGPATAISPPRRLRAGAEEGAGDVRRRTARSSTSASCSRRRR